MTLLVTIACPTYNHENFIKQTIESFLRQKTNFRYEILIHDDASTDNTPNIIKEYATLYPELIKPVFQTVNQHSKGIKNAEIILPLIKSKYIALCEGDDYWTDPYKLQKQVDFLEANADFAIYCGHARMVSVDVNMNDKRIHAGISEDTVFTLSDFAENNYIVTCTAIFRNIGFTTLKKFIFDAPGGDWCLYAYILATTGGKVFYENSDFAVYRAHAGGIYSSLNTRGFYRFYERTLRVIYKLLQDPVLKLKSRQKRNWYLEQIFREYLEGKKSWKAFRVWALLLGNRYPAKSALLLLLEWKNH